MLIGVVAGIADAIGMFIYSITGDPFALTLGETILML